MANFWAFLAHFDRFAALRLRLTLAKHAAIGPPMTNPAPKSDHDFAALIADLAQAGRTAQRALAAMESDARASALIAAAQALRNAKDDILQANQSDCANARANGLGDAMVDRLALTPERLEAVANGVEAVSRLPDPVGVVIDKAEPPNGLKLSRVRVPIGLIGIIYESRPNVTADTAALSIRSGNAVLLRGGTEAVQSNRAIHAAMATGLAEGGVPAQAVQLMPTQDRAAVGAMLGAGQTLRMMGEYDRAIRMGQRVLQKQEDDGDALFLVGATHFQKGENEAAKRYLERFLETSPELEVALEVEGMLQVVRGEVLPFPGAEDTVEN